MAHAMQQQKFTAPVKFQKFSKYDFVESFVSVAKDEKVKEEDKEKIQAAMIADAIEETQTNLLENLATKEDLKKLEISTKENLVREIKMLEISLKREIQGNLIKLGVLITVLLGVLPLGVAYLKQLFGL